MRLAAACALLLVLAGCGGVMTAPTEAPPGTETPTATPSTDVSVIGGGLPFDATVVFQRVVNLTGERVPAPIVYVEDSDEESPDILDTARSPFRTALGVTPPARNGSDDVRLNAYTPADGNAVHIYDHALRNETAAESTLAHEFVHVVQFQGGWAESVWQVDPDVPKGSISYDRELTYYLVIEGAAEYTQARYEREFQPDRPPRLAALQAAYENASAYQRLSIARYSIGAAYVANRTDSARDLEAVHRHPPTSSEQVLHNSTDPVESLTVATNETGNWSVETRDRQGELFTRIALRTELNRSTAVDAATGWGEDRRLTFVQGNATGTAWTLHWDDAANATEFVQAFEAYLDAKATERDGVWYEDEGDATYRLAQPSNETTVVLLGNETFVRAASVDSPFEERVSVTVAD